MTTRELLDEERAADVIDMSVSFLRMARLRGNVGARTPGPPYLKLGRSVRYDRADLNAWLTARRVDPAARRVARAPAAA